MKKLGLIIVLLSACASAQNFTTFSAANIQDANQNKLANGSLCLLMTDANDQPVSVQAGGGGQITKAPVCKTITNGGVTSFNIASTSATSPANPAYRITVKDSNTQQILIVDRFVQISGATFNFDNYTPVLASLSPLTGTSVSGNLSVTGNISATGTVTGTNIPAFFITQLQSITVGVTQRSTVNFTQGLIATDNAPSTRTDVSTNPPAQVNTVTFSATPTFNCALGNIQKITLTANVTSSSISNCAAGMEVAYEICENATGGFTFVPPANLNQWATIPTAANGCSVQIYFFETATVAYPDMMPGLTGDVTNTPGSLATTLANSGATPGTCGEVVVDAKGRATTCTAINATARGGTGQNSTAVFPTSGNVLTDVSTHTETNKTIDCAAGTGNVCTGVAEYEFTAAYCNNATPSTGWDLFTSGAASAACITGTNQQEGVLNFANSGTPDARISFSIPQNLATGSTVDIYLFWRTATASGTATFNVDAICVANNATDDPAFSAANFWAPSAFTASASANFLNINSATSVSLPASCTAGTLAHLRVKRTDTVGTAVTASVVKLRILFKVNKT